MSFAQTAPLKEQATNPTSPANSKLVEKWGQGQTLKLIFSECQWRIKKFFTLTQGLL